MVHHDFRPYLARPIISADSGYILCIRLLQSVPDKLTKRELEALEDMRTAAAEVQNAVLIRDATSSASLRPQDQRFDGAWAAFYGRLHAHTRLVGGPTAARAHELLTSFFPTGLKFLKHKYEPQWLHSRRLLKRIADEGLAPELVDLTGELFVTSLESAHKELGAALNLDENSEVEPAPASVGQLVDNLAAAISEYARILVGGVRTKQPASLSRFLAAVAPLDAYRARRQSSSNHAELEADEDQVEVEVDEIDEDGVDISSPLPPLPDSDGADDA